MPISFDKITKGIKYTRHGLAELWGYSSYHAIARGVITRQADNKIVLFVTEQKQASFEQYSDRLTGNILEWEGPTDHFSEDRILRSEATGDEIHLFHRLKHHSDFVYRGRLKIVKYTLFVDKPSKFTFQVI